MTYEWWADLIFCQETAEAVQKSDSLRLPSDPHQTLKDLNVWYAAKLNEEADDDRG